MASTLTNLFSRGSVHITSANPKYPPAIDPRYYSHPLDLEIMPQVLLRSLDVPRAEPLCKYLKDDGRKPPMMKEAVTQLAIATVGTHFHPVGACSMRPLEIGCVVNIDW